MALADGVAAPYDVNFCFPVRDLENDRVRLTPFIPSVHAESFIAASASHPELYQYLPFGPFYTPAELTDGLIESRIHHDPTLILFAVFNKSSDDNKHDELAGMIGYLNSSARNLSTEIGFVITLPHFQRTHVTTNAVGLLMFYALDLPSQGGLGLRRLQWQTNEMNDTSIRVAGRMGFKKEAIIRWDRVLPSGKGKVHSGVEIREGDPKPGTHGRHTVMMALCWDDWLTEREKIRSQMMPR